MIEPTLSLIGKQQVEEALKDLAKKLEGETRVLVGVPVGAGSNDGLTIATYAAVNEFGSADGHIPARPFLRPGVENGTLLYLKTAELGIPKVLSGQMTMRMVLEQIGNMAQVSVQTAIHDKTDPPNAASTIAAKGSSHPLIDHGNQGGLLGAIRYVIDDNNEPIEEGL
jgi:hypothetical protein